MTFYENQLFHIYNQGNNRQQVFFSDENYQFFIWKMRGYLLPYGDFVGWTLMPNHFHWLFYVKRVEITRKELRTHFDQVEFQRRVQKYGKNAKPVKMKDERLANENKLIDLNETIGILEGSYSKAINIQEQRTGSLFRKRAKSKDGWMNEFVLPEIKSSKLPVGKNYGYNCLYYLHQNPVKANLVEKAEHWKYSSAKDYAGKRQGTLCNVELGKQLLNFI